MRQPDFIIKIAADSIAQLRRSDVERVRAEWAYKPDTSAAL